MALSWLFGGNDRALAADRYAGRESADDRNARRAAKQSAQRQARHQRTGATRAARAGQAWDDQDRMREKYGRGRRR